MAPERPSKAAELRLEAAGDPKAVPAARRTVQGLEDYVDEACIQQVVLLVSELVTNAIVHGGADEADSLQLSVRVFDHCLRVEVRDPGTGLPETATPRPPSREIGGWGLVLVEQLADRWGKIEDPPKGVWFELDRREADR